jgi:hypothetical protein
MTIGAATDLEMHRLQAEDLRRGEVAGREDVEQRRARSAERVERFGVGRSQDQRVGVVAARHHGAHGFADRDQERVGARSLEARSSDRLLQEIVERVGECQLEIVLDDRTGLRVLEEDVRNVTRNLKECVAASARSRLS